MYGEGRAKGIIGLLESGYFDEKRPGVDVYFEKEGVDIKGLVPCFGVSMPP